MLKVCEDGHGRRSVTYFQRWALSSHFKIGTIQRGWRLILSKIRKKIGVNRCQILRLKHSKFDFRWGSVPDAARGAYSAPPDPLVAFKVAYL